MMPANQSRCRKSAVVPTLFFSMKRQSFTIRCNAPLWGLYENHFPGLAGKMIGASILNEIPNFQDPQSYKGIPCCVAMRLIFAARQGTVV